MLARLRPEQQRAAPSSNYARAHRGERESGSRGSVFKPKRRERAATSSEGRAGGLFARAPLPAHLRPRVLRPPQPRLHRHGRSCSARVPLRASCQGSGKEAARASSEAAEASAARAESALERLRRSPLVGRRPPALAAVEEGLGRPATARSYFIERERSPGSSTASCVAVGLGASNIAAAKLVHGHHQETRPIGRLLRVRARREGLELWI